MFNSSKKVLTSVFSNSSATAEKILQISTKLNGLAAEAQSYENGSSFTSADTYVLTELEVRDE